MTLIIMSAHSCLGRRSFYRRKLLFSLKNAKVVLEIAQLAIFYDKSCSRNLVAQLRLWSSSEPCVTPARFSWK